MENKKPEAKELTDEELFRKGFNHAIVLAEENPDLLKSLLSNQKEMDKYFEGLIEGKRKYEIDKKFSKEKETTQELSDLRKKSMERDKRRDLER